MTHQAGSGASENTSSHTMESTTDSAVNLSPQSGEPGESGESGESAVAHIPLSHEQLRQIPKVELHRHLDCSMRFSTLRELAPLLGIDAPKDEAGFRKAMLVTEPMKDLGAVLSKFLVAQKVLATEEILTRLAFEAVEDAAREGIRILELRYAPTFIADGHAHLTFDKIHQAFLRGLEKAESQGLPVATGLICIVQRISPIEVATRVMQFAIDNKDTFVGVDLADNEVGFDSLPFAELFQKARAAGLHITVHSGESDVPEAPKFVMNAIEHLGAERIGHGLQIVKDPKVMAEVKRLKIPLELCPTSNWLTNAIPDKDSHPIRKLMEFGISVTINTDDPGVFDFDMVHEYELLQSKYGFTQSEFDHINDTAAAASFIAHDKKQKYWPRPILK